MLEKYSLSKINFLNVVFTIIFFTISMIVIIDSINNDNYNKRVQELEDNYISKNKELVKSEVLRTVQKIDSLRKHFKREFKKDYEYELQEQFLDFISADRFGENSYGYFWVNTLDYKMLYHPQKDLIGTDIKKFKTLDGEYFFQKVNKLLKEKKEGFISYKWTRPDTNEVDEKISYVYLIEDWGYVIGAGFYLKELKEMLNSEKFKLKKSLEEQLVSYLSALFILAFISIMIALYISQKMANIEKLQKEHFNMLKQYQMILDNSAVVSKADTRGIITYVNDAFCKISGYSKEELIGKPHNIVRNPQTPKRQFKKLWATIKSGKIFKGVIKNRKKNGENYYNSTTIVPIKNSNGVIVEYISSGTDVSELFRNKRKLQTIFKTDTLTGLGNRINLIDTINQNHLNATLALINIERFKEINDSYGHAIGDEIIKELANRLFKYFSDERYQLFRVQGDIFAVYSIIIDYDEIKDSIRKFIEINDKTSFDIIKDKFIITFSSGIVNGSGELLAYADIALNDGKKRKQKLCEYDINGLGQERFRKNIEWVNRISKAIENNSFVPFFQPIYNYHTQKIEKYECLMRLVENDKVITPNHFLTISKKTKFYQEISEMVIKKSMDFFANNSFEFSINLSVEDLINKEFMGIIYDYGIYKNVLDRLVIEIVESEEMEDYDEIKKRLSIFKKEGTKIAIDDFGTGYSNYDYLVSLQADYIKIDGSITKHILSDERTAEVVKSIVNFARKSDIKTIAEFVSSKEIDEKIKELDVDFAQGYFYGKAENFLF